MRNSNIIRIITAASTSSASHSDSSQFKEYTPTPSIHGTGMGRIPCHYRNQQHFRNQIYRRKSTMRNNIIIRTITAVAAASTLFSIPCYAGSNTLAEEFAREGDYYCVNNNSAETTQNLKETVSEISPSVCQTTLSACTTYRNKAGKEFIDSEGYKFLDSIINQCDHWTASNIQLIVPQGTACADVPEVVAEWVAANLSYDRTALSDNTLCRSYQNALPGLTTGKGVCTTYATEFNTLVQAVPINPDTNCADYTCTDPEYYRTKTVQSKTHSWSAISFSEDTWHYYDITFYDNGDGAVQTKYLDMTPEVLGDGHHTEES